jgi:hypothetical protein
MMDFEGAWAAAMGARQRQLQAGGGLAPPPAGAGATAAHAPAPAGQGPLRRLSLEEDPLMDLYRTYLRQGSATFSLSLLQLQQHAAGATPPLPDPAAPGADVAAATALLHGTSLARFDSLLTITTVRTASSGSLAAAAARRLDSLEVIPSEATAPPQPPAVPNGSRAGAAAAAAQHIGGTLAQPTADPGGGSMPQLHRGAPTTLGSSEWAQLLSNGGPSASEDPLGGSSNRNGALQQAPSSCTTVAACDPSQQPQATAQPARTLPPFGCAHPAWASGRGAIWHAAAAPAVWDPVQTLDTDPYLQRQPAANMAVSSLGAGTSLGATQQHPAQQQLPWLHQAPAAAGWQRHAALVTQWGSSSLASFSSASGSFSIDAATAAATAGLIASGGGCGGGGGGRTGNTVLPGPPAGALPSWGSSAMDAGGLDAALMAAGVLGFASGSNGGGGGDGLLQQRHAPLRQQQLVWQRHQTGGNLNSLHQALALPGTLQPGLLQHQQGVHAPASTTAGAAQHSAGRSSGPGRAAQAGASSGSPQAAASNVRQGNGPLSGSGLGSPLASTSMGPPPAQPVHLVRAGSQSEQAAAGGPLARAITRSLSNAAAAAAAAAAAVAEAGPSPSTVGAAAKLQPGAGAAGESGARDMLAPTSAPPLPRRGSRARSACGRKRRRAAADSSDSEWNLSEASSGASGGSSSGSGSGADCYGQETESSGGSSYVGGGRRRRRGARSSARSGTRTRPGPRGGAAVVQAAPRVQAAGAGASGVAAAVTGDGCTAAGVQMAAPGCPAVSVMSRPQQGPGAAAAPVAVAAEGHSSSYRGVTRHRRSGRFESHIWIREMGK